MFYGSRSPTSKHRETAISLPPINDQAGTRAAWEAQADHLSSSASTRFRPGGMGRSDIKAILLVGIRENTPAAGDATVVAALVLAFST